MDRAVREALREEGLVLRTSFLYKIARFSTDVDALERAERTGSPAPQIRRAENRALGRVLGRAGVWRRLWR